LRVGGYRFFFFSSDRWEPPHTHVVRDLHRAKVWLLPVRLQHSGGFRSHELNRIMALVELHQDRLMRAWNEYSDREGPQPSGRPPIAIGVTVTDDELIVSLDDGRTVSVPLVWYPRLLHGEETERANWRMIGRGEGIHWPDLDEDISVEGLLAGRPSGESQKSLKRWLEERESRGVA
jgi:hypothetical protein